MTFKLPYLLLRLIKWLIISFFVGSVVSISLSIISLFIPVGYDMFSVIQVFFITILITSVTLIFCIPDFEEEKVNFENCEKKIEINYLILSLIIVFYVISIILVNINTDARIVAHEREGIKKTTNAMILKIEKLSYDIKFDEIFDLKEKKEFMNKIDKICLKLTLQKNKSELKETSQNSVKDLEKFFNTLDKKEGIFIGEQLKLKEKRDEALKKYLDIFNNY